MRTLGNVTGDAISTPTGRPDQGVLAQALGLTKLGAAHVAVAG